MFALIRPLDDRILLYSFEQVSFWDWILPHAYLLLAYYSVAARKRTLGCFASALGIEAYLRVTQKYRFYWLASTILLCFSHLYAAIKLAELAIILLTRREREYDAQDDKQSLPLTPWSRIWWAMQMTSNLRCIGLKGGKREYLIRKPTRSDILVPILLKSTVLDILTSALHHLSLFNNHLPFIQRPIWQQLLITVIFPLSLALALQCIYGWFEFIGIYLFGMEPSQWPPMLVRPWAATSLRQFWSKEWHSVFRRVFTFFTDLLLKPIFGWTKFPETSKVACQVLGVFLMSAIMHDAGLYLALGEHSYRTIVFFLIQGPAILLEDWIGITNYPILGAIWTYSFLVITGGPLGMIGKVVDYRYHGAGLLTDGFMKEVSITTRIIRHIFHTDL